MRKLLIVMLSLTMLLGSFYAYSVYNSEKETDELIVTLREKSFLPIWPPVSPASKIHTVGALYYIYPDLSTFKVICSPPKESLDKYVHESKSAALGGARTWQGTYTSNLEAKARQPIKGKGSINDKRLIRVRYELKDVRIYEIELGPIVDIYEQLMTTESCVEAVKQYLDISGYICQDIQLLAGSALIKFNSETDTEAGVDVDTKTALDSELATNFQLNTNEGRSTSGQGLQWGIQMAPRCLTPSWARFQRTFPRNNFDKMVNFIKFNILEPILPAT